MADLETKTATDLTENTSVSTSDIFIVGNAGTSALRRITWSNILTAIKNKIASWTFDTLEATKITGDSNCYFNGNIYLANGKRLYGYEASGSARTIATITTEDAYQLCTGSFTNTIQLGSSSCTQLTLKASSYYRGSFKIPEIQHGTVSVTPSAANTPTGVAVTFSTSFSGAPNITLGAGTSVPGTQVTGIGFTSNSKTGVTIYLTRTNTTSTSVHWQAMYN